MPGRAAASKHPFGNDPAKCARYRAFWRRDPAARPLAGFSLVGWFPLAEFAACRAWQGRDFVTPDMVDPSEWLDDHERLLREGETLDDDLIRGAGPSAVAIPFLPAMLGCPLRLLPENVLGLERGLSWDEALAVRLDPRHPWYRKYMAFADALVERAAGRFPVSHSAEIGPSDLHGALRGHTQAIADLVDEPERACALLAHTAGMFKTLTEAVWRRLPRFAGGWFDGQYSLWAPGPIARLQEDASAVYSPRLYRELLQPVDRALARAFPCAFIHLHSTSMFLLDAFLEIQELRCFEINNDASGPPVAEMIPHFREVQRAGRSLLVRGAFAPEELRALVGGLDPAGLALLIMVRDLSEVERLRPIIGL